MGEARVHQGAARLPPQPTDRHRRREADTAALHDQLAEGGPRLQTIVGAPGVGKSRLALEVAATVDSRRFPDGVALVDLSEVTTPDQVAVAIAGHLSVPIRDELQPHAAIVEAVGRRRLLLVLDNVDLLLDDATFIDLLTRLRAVDANGPVLLLTCRRRLGLQGERVHALAPLAVEPEGISPACRLFADRAAAVVPGFALGPTVAATVAGICRRCDGLPLAIELAAARLGHLTLDDLFARLASPSGRPHRRAARPARPSPLDARGDRLDLRPAAARRAGAGPRRLRLP
jgi:non-specific serine/threonine protein kinase